MTLKNLGHPRVSGRYVRYGRTRLHLKKVYMSQHAGCVYWHQKWNCILLGPERCTFRPTAWWRCWHISIRCNPSPLPRNSWHDQWRRPITFWKCKTPVPLPMHLRLRGLPAVRFRFHNTLLAPNILELRVSTSKAQQGEWQRRFCRPQRRRRQGDRNVVGATATSSPWRHKLLLSPTRAMLLLQCFRIGQNCMPLRGAWVPSLLQWRRHGE